MDAPASPALRRPPARRAAGSGPSHRVLLRIRRHGAGIVLAREPHLQGRPVLRQGCDLRQLRGLLHHALLELWLEDDAPIQGQLHGLLQWLLRIHLLQHLLAEQQLQRQRCSTRQPLWLHVQLRFRLLRQQLRLVVQWLQPLQRAWYLQPVQRLR